MAFCHQKSTLKQRLKERVGRLRALMTCNQRLAICSSSTQMCQMTETPCFTSWIWRCKNITKWSSSAATSNLVKGQIAWPHTVEAQRKAQKTTPGFWTTRRLTRQLHSIQSLTVKARWPKISTAARRQRQAMQQWVCSSNSLITSIWGLLRMSTSKITLYQVLKLKI